MLICLTAFQVGRERQMAFCFMQKFVDLQKIGTKVPIITAFALDHVRGFVFVEAEKACDVTEVHFFFLFTARGKNAFVLAMTCRVTCTALCLLCYYCFVEYKM